jgi:hypothetical protein
VGTAAEAPEPAPRRARVRAWAALTGAALLVSLVLYQEIFRLPYAIGPGDYYQFHHIWEFGVQALLRHHELPLWNPHACGGYPDVGDAQTQVHHPLFYLALVLGSTLGLKLFLVLHAAAGFAGMYLFARREEELGVPSAALAAVVWTSSGFFAWHCGTGHGGFVGYYLVPWLLLCWRLAVRTPRLSVGVAVVLTLVLLSGGANAFPHLLVVLAFDAVVQLIRRPERRRGVMIAALAVALLTLLIGAWRLLPVLEHVLLYPRVRVISDRLSLGELVDILTRAYGSSEGGPVPGHPYTRPEYGGYVGLFTIALAVLGFAWRRRWWLLAGLVVFGWLAMGDTGALAPWPLLKRLPLFGSLQAPSRFLFAVSLFVILLAAHGFDELLARLRERLDRLDRTERVRRALWTSTAAAALVLSSLPVVLQHRSVLDGIWRGPPLGTDPPETELHLVDVKAPGPDLGRFPANPSLPTRNLGTGWCYTGLGYEPAYGLWAGREAQVQAVPAGNVHSYRRTTRTFTAELELPERGRAVFNQTFSPGWRTNVGELRQHAGATAVDLPAGRQRVILRYAPVSLYWAALCSLLGIGAALAFAWQPATRLHRRLRMSAIAAAAGLAATSYAVVLSAAKHEPRSTGRIVAFAAASGFAESDLNDLYAPANAVDGKPRSEWLAPPGRKAWLALRLKAPKRVFFVRLQNARNLPHDDFHTLTADVESYRGPRLLRSVVARFPPPDGTGQVWVDLDGEEIDRVRIVIREWSGRGGGLAEVGLY